MTLFPKEKQCSKCGQPFDCGGLLGCWCRDVKLDEATLASLKAAYADCLCPNCLKAEKNTVTDASLTTS
jgi:hypothetical protein